jgi:uncharacterized membrane protein
MDKMIVVVFDNETNAYEASRALKEMHDEGSIAVYAGAVISKDADGRVSVKERTDQGPIGTLLGMATGALIGVLGGPAGVAIGATAGTPGGTFWDIATIGVGDDFVAEVSKALRPGKSAVVAEVDEWWIIPLDTRMDALGGTIFRRVRADVVDAHLEREAAVHRAELDELNAELSRARGEEKAKLKEKYDAAKASLNAANDRTKARIEDTRREADAKIRSLQAQASKASADAKARLDKRAAAIEADYQSRTRKLDKAWQLTKESLSA